MIITTYTNGKKENDLFRELKEKHVEILIDARFSDTYPVYFRRAALNSACEKSGMLYHDAKLAGNPPELRKKFADDPVEMKVAYLLYLNQIHQKKGILDTLVELVNGKTACIICYCKTEDPALCHRFWLKEVLDKKIEKI